MTLHENWIQSSHFIVESLERNAFVHPTSNKHMNADADLCAGVRMFVRYAEPDDYTLAALLCRIDYVETRLA